MIKFDTWYWFGVIGLSFMIVTIFTIAVGLFR